MVTETISQRPDLFIRRHILEPGESLPWHRDLYHRFTVIVTGETIDIEYRESKEIKTIHVHPVRQSGMLRSRKSIALSIPEKFLMKKSLSSLLMIPEQSLNRKLK